MLLEDLRIKHLAALVGNEIGKGVYILSINIDPEVYYLESDGKRLEGTDYQIATVEVREIGTDTTLSVSIGWDIKCEEIITYKFNN